MPSPTKRASDSRFVNKTLATSSFHAETLLASGVIIFLVFQDVGRLGAREQAAVALLWRARLLDEFGTVGEEIWSSGGHANGIEIGKVVAWGSGELVVISRRLPCGG